MKLPTSCGGLPPAITNQLLMEGPAGKRWKRHLDKHFTRVKNADSRKTAAEEKRARKAEKRARNAARTEQGQMMAREVMEHGIAFSRVIIDPIDWHRNEPNPGA